MPNVLFTSLRQCEEGHGFLFIQKYAKSGKRNGTTCYTCHCERKLRWRSAKQRFIRWATPLAIAKIYEEAANEGLHVDHIYPLRGDDVSGLHVAENLQKLTPLENQQKNKYWKE